LEYDQIADFGPKVPCLFILMEYANSGSLETYIEECRKRRQYIPEAKVWKFFIDLCKGLGYLHHCGIIHRDLKPSNLLLNMNYDAETDSQIMNLMISDFGTCESQTASERLRRTGNTGTVEYLAPELLKGMRTVYVMRNMTKNVICGRLVYYYTRCAS
jgi:serine/threonine protein kinase